jgi:sugar/nucleoside kinase (ribokinase family)
VVDATGAGDAFDAAFMARYLRDGDLAAAARVANDIGSWVVARYGARPPADEELAKILARQ